MAEDAQTAGAPAAPRYGGRLGYGIFHALIRGLGPRAAYLLLALILPYYLLLRPAARRGAAPYLRRRFPHAGPLTRLWLTARWFFQFGQTLIDRAAAGILGQERLRVEFPEERALYDRAQRRRGLILLTTHAGNWQLAMVYLANMEVPVHLQFRLEEMMAGRHMFDLARRRDAFKFIAPDGFMGGMVELTNALKAGECVAVMGDRAWGGRMRKARLLGAEAELPVAAYHLARATGADVVALLTTRTGVMRCRIEAHYLTDGLETTGKSREELIDELLGRYTARLEDYLAREPFMWFNFFDCWKAKENEN